MIYVVGSGPSGVSCSLALINQGLEVTMLDSGLELEADRQVCVDKLSKSDPENWDKESLNVIKRHTLAGSSGIDLKYVYGSDFPYRSSFFGSADMKNALIYQSFAKGGLSNVWGAAVLPYVDSDINDWPISVNDLSPHYESVLNIMDLAAVDDDLAKVFPLYIKNFHPLKPSRQALTLMEDLLCNKESLNSRGFVFGYSRVAVQAIPRNERIGCVYCGLCLYGCPYQLIYNSSFTLEKLKSKSTFKYLKNVLVYKIKEEKGVVRIYARSLVNNEELIFNGERLYLACGVLSSTKILLESLECYDHFLTIKDSQWFLLPMIRFVRTGDVVNERLYTLPQIFIELFDPNITKGTINLQVYTYNDLYLATVKRFIGQIGYKIFKLPIDEFLGRLIVVMGFLHSDVSSKINVKLVPALEKGKSKLILEGCLNKDVKEIVGKVTSKLLSVKDFIKAIPIPAVSKLKPPGSGTHSGGTFPMKHKPSQFESDVLGRPYGFTKVHVVDASIFSSIPATSITLTIMANAHRIGSKFNEI